MSIEKREGIDLMNFVCGELLGSGEFRHVYRARFDEKVVLKYERQNKERNNIFEYDIWCAYKDLELGKWLAPCLMISPDGTWLAQSFCENLQEHQLPTNIPAFFSDLKPENWGWYEGRAVCRDYGFSNLYHLAHRTGMRMKKVDWRKDSSQFRNNWRKNEN